jgi:hypothetical protein
LIALGDCRGEENRNEDEKKNLHLRPKEKRQKTFNTTNTIFFLPNGNNAQERVSAREKRLCVDDRRTVEFNRQRLLAFERLRQLHLLYQQRSSVNC